MLYCLFVFLLCVLIGVVLYIWIKSLEYLWCIFVLHQIPFVASDRILRRATVQVINRFCPNVKTVCEIGSGYGGLARFVARKCGAYVVALENMPFTCFVAKIGALLPGDGRVKNIREDAFKYLKNGGQSFDVGVAYLGPVVNARLVGVMPCFKILIVLDVPIPYVEPVAVIDVGRGFTRYGRLKFPHKLFVYKN
jgi:SAM-dependent methyltransferase